MKVHIYLPDYNPKLAVVLRAFAAGIDRVNPGWAEVRPLGDPAPCDVAVIFGLVKKSYEPTWAKAPILEHHSGRGLLVIESAFVRRGAYWSVGFGGINGGADFRSEGMPPDRWQALGIKSKRWHRREDGPVVVCGQLPRDTNVQDTDHAGWCRRAVAFYEKRGLPVVFRPHPRIEDPEIYGVDPALFDPNRKLRETLREARVLVTYNSNSGTDAAIAGVPVVACDPGSFAWPVAAHGLTAVERLRRPSRRAWLAGLGYSQWSLEEMREGAPWRHLTRP